MTSTKRKTVNNGKENTCIGVYVAALWNVMYLFWLRVGYLEKHT